MVQRIVRQTMHSLDGTIWRLVDSRAWNEHSDRLSAPYGAHPIGQISFVNGRMLAALGNGDTTIREGCVREYSSYGGPYSFDGETLTTTVDVASDPARIGSRQVRSVIMVGEQMLLRPPAREYGAARQRRELIWECVWRADDAVKSPSQPAKPADL
jgi:hypothetical protein